MCVQLLQLKQGVLYTPWSNTLTDQEKNTDCLSTVANEHSVLRVVVWEAGKLEKCEDLSQTVKLDICLSNEAAAGDRITGWGSLTCNRPPWPYFNTYLSVIADCFFLDIPVWSMEPRFSELKGSSATGATSSGVCWSPGLDSSGQGWQQNAKMWVFFSPVGLQLLRPPQIFFLDQLGLG